MNCSGILKVSVSDACQINDFDHNRQKRKFVASVSDACQINDFDHCDDGLLAQWLVSDACQINDLTTLLL